MTTAATTDLAACLMRIERDVASIGATGFATGGSCVRLVRTHGDTLQRALALLEAVESAIEGGDLLSCDCGCSRLDCGECGPEIIGPTDPRDSVEATRAMLADAPPPPIESVSPWRPIETAPEEGQFLVYMPEERTKIQVANWHTNVKVIGSVFAFDLTKPTHWMPLPAAPAAPGVEG